MELTPELWSAEYNYVRAIPSTTETRPSRALSKLLDELPPPGPHSKALDVGSGNGRHSVLLAKLGFEVTAVDFAAEAVNSTENLAAKAGLVARVQTKQCSIQEFFDSSNEQFEVFLDSYASCHFVQSGQFEEYWDEVPAHLAASGVIYTSQFLDSDRYYRQFVEPSLSMGRLVSKDPLNRIAKLLFSREQLQNFLEHRFKILASTEVSFSDRVGDGVYQRAIFAALLTK